MGCLFEFQIFVYFVLIYCLLGLINGSNSEVRDVCRVHFMHPLFTLDEIILCCVQNEIEET